MPKVKIDLSQPERARYDRGVLVGNWIENRATDIIVDEKNYAMTTEIRDNYICRKPINVENEFWDNAFQADGLPYSFTFDDGPCYFHNFTSSYTLEYDYLTRGLCGPKFRTFHKTSGEFRPQPDHIQSYGNLTYNGLRDRILWDRKCANEPLDTLYRDSYKPHSKDAYVLEHHVHPKEVPPNLDIIKAQMIEHNMAHYLL